MGNRWICRVIAINTHLHANDEQLGYGHGLDAEKPDQIRSKIIGRRNSCRASSSVGLKRTMSIPIWSLPTTRTTDPKRVTGSEPWARRRLNRSEEPSGKIRADLTSIPLRLMSTVSPSI